MMRPGRPFICFRFWYFFGSLLQKLPKSTKVPLRSGTFCTFYHFVLPWTFFGEKSQHFYIKPQLPMLKLLFTKSTKADERSQKHIFLFTSNFSAPTFWSLRKTLWFLILFPSIVQMSFRLFSCIKVNVPKIHYTQLWWESIHPPEMFPSYSVLFQFL